MVATALGLIDLLEIDRELGNVLRKKYNSALVSSIERLAQNSDVNTQLKIRTALTFLENIMGRNGSATYHPSLTYFRTLAMNDIAPKDLEKLCEKLTANIAESIGEQKRNQMDVSWEWDLRLVDEFGQNSTELTSLAAARAVGFSCNLRRTHAPREELAEAASLISETLPETYVLMQDFVQKVVFFEGRKYLSFSDPDRHGTIFIRLDAVKASPMYLAELLIHESAHIILNTMMALNPIVENPKDEWFASPLRRDRRPMSGLIHQLYVLVYLHKFYSKLRNTSKVEEITLKMRDAYATISQHGKFTSFGQALKTNFDDYFRKAVIAC